MTFVPSEEQAAIFKAVLETQNNVAIRALAGTGKTTTLVELAKQLPRNGRDSKIFCAFNKDIVSELEGRLTGTGMRAQTFHSIGFCALKKHLGVQQITPNNHKYRDIVSQWAETSNDLKNTINNAVANVQNEKDRQNAYKDYWKESMNMAVDLCSFLRYALAEWHDQMTLREIIWSYHLDDGINMDEDITQIILDQTEPFMKEAEKRLKDNLDMDFTDMIYWPVRWEVKFFQHNWVFVDECQDLSPMQRRMIEMIIWPRGGRIALVGDPHQAIYAFAGADSDSFDLSVQTFNATVMPLTVTRRCAQVITHHAADLVPAFRCPPDKPRGKVVWIDETRIDVMKPGDMVLCRVKAPLVKLILELLAANKAATILGAEIGEKLIQILDKLEKRDGYSFETLVDTLQAYEDEQVEKHLKKNDEAMAEAVKDQCAALRIIVENAKSNDADGLKIYIQSLFSAKANKDLIVLSTVHKSKGLEAERIFILAPEKLPLIHAGQSAEARQQEDNLDYVARTRAKNVLVYLTNKKFLQDTFCPEYVQTDFDDHDWTDEDLSHPTLDVVTLDNLVGTSEQDEEPNPLKLEVTDAKGETQLIPLPNVPVEDADPDKPLPVPTTKKEIDAMRTMDEPETKPGSAEHKQQQAIEWAKKMLNEGFVVLDYETTGLEGEPVQISLIDHTGAVLLSTYVHPEKKKIADAARNTHGISEEMVKDAPTFRELQPKLTPLLMGKNVIAYNAGFEEKITNLTYKLYNSAMTPIIHWHCAMLKYAAYKGDWSDYHKNYRWWKLAEACENEAIKLEGSANDVRATLALIKKMAGVEPTPEPAPVEVPAPAETPPLTGDLTKDLAAYKEVQIVPVVPQQDRLLQLANDLTVSEIDRMVAILLEVKAKKLEESPEALLAQVDAPRPPSDTPF